MRAAAIPNRIENGNDSSAKYFNKPEVKAAIWGLKTAKEYLLKHPDAEDVEIAELLDETIRLLDEEKVTDRLRVCITTLNKIISKLSAVLQASGDSGGLLGGIRTRCNLAKQHSGVLLLEITKIEREEEQIEYKYSLDFVADKLNLSILLSDLVSSNFAFYSSTPLEESKEKAYSDLLIIIKEISKIANSDEGRLVEFPAANDLIASFYSGESTAKKYTSAEELIRNFIDEYLELEIATQPEQEIKQDLKDKVEKTMQPRKLTKKKSADTKIAEFMRKLKEYTEDVEFFEEKRNYLDLLKKLRARTRTEFNEIVLDTIDMTLYALKMKGSYSLRGKSDYDELTRVKNKYVKQNPIKNRRTNEEVENDIQKSILEFYGIMSELTKLNPATENTDRAKKTAKLAYLAVRIASLQNVGEDYYEEKDSDLELILSKIAWINDPF